MSSLILQNGPRHDKGGHVILVRPVVDLNVEMGIVRRHIKEEDSSEITICKGKGKKLLSSLYIYFIL